MALLRVFAKVNLLSLLYIIVAGLMNLRCFFRTHNSVTVHEQFLGKRRKGRGGGSNCLILNLHFFPPQERNDPKYYSTCSTDEDKDSELLRTMVGMLNFRTDFESLGRNFDLSLTMLSIIHL